MRSPETRTPRRRAARIIGLAAGVIVVVALTAYLAVQWDRLTEPAAPGASATWTTAPDRPAHQVLFKDVLGKPLPEAERLLGISTDKITLTLSGPPVVVAVPDDIPIDTVPAEQLTVTALCTSQEKAPAQTLYIGTTPTADYNQEVSRRSPAHLSRLAELTGCDLTGFVGIAVYND